MHSLCTGHEQGVLPEETPCCCLGTYDPFEHKVYLEAREMAVHDKISRQFSDDGEYPGSAPTAAYRDNERKGFSGYIHPDAWQGAQDIGTLADPASTGRKRVDRMYPIPVGYQCEWANLKNCGGGLFPIIGCLGNAATDRHHGIDKNTLNNEKASVGIGTVENVHLICSRCHNTWHGLNDQTYPEFDRIADQASPWVPEGAGWHDPVEATSEELLAEEARRRADPRYMNRKGRAGTIVVETEMEE